MSTIYAASHKLTTLALAFTLLSSQAFAASAFDPSSNFPSRDTYCANVRSIAGALYTSVDHAAGGFHTTFTDVINHNALNSLYVIGVENVNHVDYLGMLSYLLRWDTNLRETQARLREGGYPDKAAFLGSYEVQNRTYSRMIYEQCKDNTL